MRKASKSTLVSSKPGKQSEDKLPRKRKRKRKRLPIDTPAFIMQWYMQKSKSNGRS